jgi:hypothetical protein
MELVYFTIDIFFACIVVIEDHSGKYVKNNLVVVKVMAVPD